MARQAGPIYLTGTIDDITFYKMEGEYFARKKSSLNRKKFRTDPRFARSRKSAAAFGDASKLASDIYWLLPKAQRGKGVVNRLTGLVGTLMRQGHTPEEVKTILLQQMGVVCCAKQPDLDIAPQEKLVHAGLSRWRITPKGTLSNALIDDSSLAQLESPNSIMLQHLIAIQNE